MQSRSAIVQGGHLCRIVSNETAAANNNDHLSTRHLSALASEVNIEANSIDALTERIVFVFNDLKIEEGSKDLVNLPHITVTDVSAHLVFVVSANTCRQCEHFKYLEANVMFTNG